MICPHCGQPKVERAELGPLLVTREPNAVYWSGVRQDGLQTAQLEMLFLLAQRGETTHLALEMLTTSNGACIKVQINRMRGWLKKRGLPLRIDTIYGRGYRLQQIL